MLGAIGATALIAALFIVLLHLRMQRVQLIASPAGA
jgi:hypothetical protein